jgi:precorrin-6Y C5,15-methyltransferase (decarboxylating)
MKRISIIGVGLGPDTLTPEARAAIARAEVLLGAPRLLEPYGEKPSYPYYLPKDAAACIEREDATEFAVLVSGDVGFYSAAAGLFGALPGCELRVIPGVSTVNAFFARLRMPWQDAAFVSVHGREANVVEAVRRNRLTFCLPGNNTDEIGAALVKAGFGCVKTHIGERLGTDRERIYETVAEDLTRTELPSPAVLLFENDAFDAGTLIGLPDDAFSRLPGIPMTKSETRAIVLSKLKLRPDDICWDIGAGTGSVTVETALSVYRGRVYAAERRKEAIPLIEQNCAAFHVGNVVVVCGEAPDALESLPAPDAVFIGGSGGKTGEIIAAVLRRNPEARIVVTAVTIETAASASAAFEKAGLRPELVQLNVARGRQAGKSRLMEAQNPVTILSAGGKP